MGGIYGMSTLILMRTKEKYGSLIKGMQHEKVNVLKRQLYPGAPKGQFKQFRHGLSSFIEALAKMYKIKA